MIRIGLTGGIAAGKSTAAKRFVELGAHLIDHDDLARRAVAPGAAALVEIVHEFGDNLIVHGKLDRQALADLVFHNLNARDKLNAIVHPYVYAMARSADKHARAQGMKVVVHDIPLLVETGQGNDFSLVVTVAADEELRVQRLIEGRGLRRDDALARIRAQATDEERAESADIVLNGNGSVDDLRTQVDQLWATHLP